MKTGATDLNNGYNNDMERIGFKSIDITGGFWKEKQQMLKNSTVKAVYDRFYETGRFEAFKCDKDSKIKPHIFWDSDVAKWVEGVAYLLSKERNSELEKIIDDLVSDIEKNQQENGYFNTYYIVTGVENHFTIMDNHELYCAGHLIEAAVAYYEATGKRKLLDLMCKYVDYIEKRFKIQKDTSFNVPGHEEIELALVRLYEVTKDIRHLELSKFFVDERGTKIVALNGWAGQMYNQNHTEAKNQKTAEGHAVRALYFYSAMADIALKYDDECLKNACESIFDDIADYKMYITGGVGSSHAGEAFTVKYDLPSLVAYTESCAAIALVYFASRMLLLTNDAKYSNVIERVLYNGFLSSVSLDGKSFFYRNPLEILPYLHTRDVSVSEKSFNLPITRRQEVFECSCCPPNIVRFIASIGDYLYTKDENAIYVHQFAESKANIEYKGKNVKIEQKTSYPLDGKVSIKVSGADVKLYVRIPEFVVNYTGKTDKGYGVFEIKDGETITFDFDMTPKLIESNPLSVFTAGKYAVQRGPVVYCMEECDNGSCLRDIRIDKNTSYEEIIDTDLGVLSLYVSASRRKATDKLYSVASDEREKINARLIPYYAFANREECEMLLWILAE